MHRFATPTPRRRRGFTLIELLLVMVILGTLAAIVVPKFAGRGEQARTTKAQTDISILKSALDQFEVDNGYYPRSSDGLDVLINQPSDAKDWRGPYVESIPKDPWDSPYSYECPGKHNTNGFDLSSPGPDKRAGTSDDVVSWPTTQQ